MPLGIVRLNSIEGVISIGFQLLSHAECWQQFMGWVECGVWSSVWACVTEKVLMMSAQMSDDWSKAPHTDVTRDFNCDQELSSPHSSVSVIRGNGGAAQNYRESLETLAVDRNGPGASRVKKTRDNPWQQWSLSPPWHPALSPLHQSDDTGGGGKKVLGCDNLRGGFVHVFAGAKSNNRTQWM